MKFDCEQSRQRLHAQQRGALAPDEAQALRDHLASCAACRSVASQERVVDELLSTRLPERSAPAALKQRLAQLVAAEANQRVALADEHPLLASSDEARAKAGQSAAAGQRNVSQREAASEHEPSAREPARPPSARPGRKRWVVPAALATALAAAVAVFIAQPPPFDRDPLVREAVNDHLRVLYAQQPIEIESGGIHQVKPWFSGKLDFAPDVAFSGDAEYPLLGGAVGYFLDRKAALFVFKHRLHTISLSVFPAHELRWPSAEEHTLGAQRVRVGALRGFHIVWWRAQDLDHALVSDLNPRELLDLAKRVIAQN
jgi:anti-sigma factor RsiW